MTDLHMHSTASDGTDSPVTLLKKILASEIRTFALTDHDTIAGAMVVDHLVELRQRTLGEDLTFIPGVEFSCITDGGKCHILGYGYDPDCLLFLQTLEKVEDLRAEKLVRRLRFLDEKIGFRLSEQELDALKSIQSVGKPHIANLMVLKGYAKDRKEAIDIINKAPSIRSRIPGEEAIHAILEAGGIPVWAHPLGGEGEKRIKKEAFWRQLSILMDAGLQGLECYYSRYLMEECEFLREEAEKNGLLVSGGSDYHGTNKDIPLGMLNATGEPIPEEKLTILNKMFGNT